jgi:hypothetical protein
MSALMFAMAWTALNNPLKDMKALMKSVFWLKYTMVSTGNNESVCPRDTITLYTFLGYQQSGAS